MAENKANIPLDDFVSKVVKDPKQPPDTTLLTGFLGKSSEEGHTRLYFDPELKNYLEIPNDAILHTQEIPKEQSSLGGSHVWIKSDADLIHGKVGPSRTKAKFFEGPIGAAAAAAGPFGPGGGAGNSVIPCVVSGASVCACFSPEPFWCPPPLTLQCPTPLQGCPLPTQFTQCPTPLHGCPPPTLQFTQCPTTLHGCPTPLAYCRPQTPFCPVASANCPSGPACGGVLQGGFGDLAAAQHAAAAMGAQSVFGPCLTALPAVCHPVCHPQTPFCPTHPAVCQPITPACPTVHACQSIPACPSAIGCPSGPACGGGPMGGGGINQ